MVLQLEDRLPEAEACFRAALQRDPDYVEALIGLGQVEAPARRRRVGPQALRDGHRDRPPPAEGPLLAGPLARITGKDRRGLAEYFRALEVRTEQRRGQPERRGHPDWRRTSRIRRCRDWTRSWSSHPTTARPATSAAVPISRCGISRRRSTTSARPPVGFPDRADIYYHLALALEADHKPADALRAAEQALRLAPDFADARGLSQRLALAVAPTGKARPRAKVARQRSPGRSRRGEGSFDLRIECMRGRT